MKRTAMLVLVAWTTYAAGQSPVQVQQGTDFAKTLAPASSSQVVNPNGVSPTAWSSTSVPSNVPTSLGGFSVPITSNAAYTAAKTSGLTTLGTSAMTSCANFVPGPTSDPLRVQECAAVNFMSNRCMTPTTVQGAVITHLGTSQITSGNCAGTYGQGASTFNMGNQVTATDPTFTVMNNLKSTAPAVVASSCTTQTVITSPAQYALNTCAKNGQTNDETCSQYLNVSVTTNVVPAKQTDSCPQGQLVGDYCVSTTTAPPTVVYACPASTTMSGSSCIGSTTNAATPSYSCPSGYTSVGSSCTLTVTTNATSAADCSIAEANAQNGHWGNTSSNLPFPAASAYGPNLCWFANGNITTFPSPAPAVWFSKVLRGVWWFYPAPTTYSCPTGTTLEGTTCVATTTTTGTITGYYCPTGTLSGSNCVTTVVTPATSTDTCPAGSTLSGGTCVMSTSTPAVVTYSCSDGSLPVNNACILHGLSESWTSTCGPYEASAGTVLPNP